jgi:hypothetical protein
VVNTGDIEVQAYSLDDLADASGIFVANNTGPIVNSGSINVGAMGPLAYANGIAIDTDYFEDLLGIIVPNSGDVTNNGTMTVSAYSGDATSRGISVDANMTGTIRNDGEISAYAYAHYTGYDEHEAAAYGIAIEEYLTGNIVNTGSILADAHANDEAYAGEGFAYSSAEAYGIDGGDDMIGDIENFDAIEANAQASAYSSESYASANAYAYGIELARRLHRQHHQ